MSWLRPSQKMLECMEAAAAGPISPWDYGSSVISALKRTGWLTRIRIDGASRYTLNAAGAAALKAERAGRSQFDGSPGGRGWPKLATPEATDEDIQKERES